MPCVCAYYVTDAVMFRPENGFDDTARVLYEFDFSCARAREDTKSLKILINGRQCSICLPTYLPTYLMCAFSFMFVQENNDFNSSWKQPVQLHTSTT